MNRSPRRAAPALRAGVLIAGIAALLGWAAGSPFDTWRALFSAIDASSPTSGFDQLLGSSAAIAAWIGLGWLCITVFLEAASALPGAAGRGCAAIAARTSPMLVRRIVQAAIGVSVLAGPMAAGSAFATGPSTTTSTSTQVDRPISAVAPTPDTSTTPYTGTAPPDLDRPATAFVPLAPASGKQTPAGPAALVTGTAHRDAAHASDRSAGGYVVHRGDTLWDIAARHLGPNATAVDISRAWPAWYEANRASIGPDPGVIRPGELLVPPSTSAPHPSAPSVGTR
jgi:resuscitation-promoting factor RpfA